MAGKDTIGAGTPKTDRRVWKKEGQPKRGTGSRRFLERAEGWEMSRKSQHWQEGLENRREPRRWALGRKPLDWQEGLVDRQERLYDGQEAPRLAGGAGI